MTDSDPLLSKHPIKIWFGSDFHYERFGNQTDVAVQRGNIPEDAPFDYMVIAGDLGHSRYIPKLLEAIHKHSKVHVFFTPGNHEFWDGYNRGADFDEQLSLMQEELEGIEGVTFLYNQGLDIPGTNYSLFMSPWFTNLSGYDEVDDDLVKVLPSKIEDRIGDYHRTTVDGKPLTAEDHIKWNKEAMNALGLWLETDVLSKGRIPLIATHFGPSANSAHGDFPYRDLVASYFNTDYLDNGGPGYIFPPGTVWIHGHTHWNVDYMIGNVRVVTNQYGYRGEECTNNSYEFLKHIEVQ
jgi:predicted phosphodiesterase